jgi:phytoene dehydrogenase-like protein
MVMEKTLIIIGAGTAGLAAGCYAQMNGYKTTILEMAQTPGGLCTSWKRKGYLFDGSVAGLAGSAPGNPLYRLWQEIGVAKYCPLHYGESFGSIRLLDGRVITIYSNVDKLESHLIDNFPSDSIVIREFCGAIRSSLDLDMPFSDAHGWDAFSEGAQSAIISIKHIPVLLKYGLTTITQFNKKIQDPDLKIVFNNLVHFGGGDVPLLTVILPLAYAHRRLAGIPIDGWLLFARAIEKRFIELGGSVRYNARVNSLIVNGKKVQGVKMENGSSLMADRVLSAVDGRFLHTHLLGKREEDLNRLFDPAKVSDQPVQVNLGVRTRGIAENGSITYILPEPEYAGGKGQNRVIVQSRSYDAWAAPEGCSVITVFLESSYSWWINIAIDKEQYQLQKEICAEFVIRTIERFNPGFREKVDVVDVSTPITRERYTGNWMGTMQARKPDSNMINALLQKSPSYEVKGIEGLYMAGQWVEPWGGITTAAQSGRKAIKALCRNDGVVFTTSIL